MLKIHVMPNTEKFLSLVEQSSGDVLLNLPDGKQCSLKKDNTARQMLRIVEPGQDGFSISFSNSDDITAFMRYFIGAAG